MPKGLASAGNPAPDERLLPAGPETYYLPVEGARRVIQFLTDEQLGQYFGPEASAKRKSIERELEEGMASGKRRASEKR